MGMSIDEKEYMQMGIDLTVDGQPVLGTYAVETLEDLEKVKEAGMNIVIGGSNLIDTDSEMGSVLAENGIKVM